MPNDTAKSPPTSPRSRKTSEKDKLQSTLVDVQPDPTSPRTRRASERQELLQSGEPGPAPISPRSRLVVERLELASTSRSLRQRKAAAEPVAGAPAPKRAKLAGNSSTGKPPRNIDEEEEIRLKEQIRQEKLVLKSGIVPLQIVFGDERTRPTKRAMEETLEMFKSVYPTIREEYDQSVRTELLSDYMQHIGCEEDDNLFRKNLLAKNYTIPKMAVGKVHKGATATIVSWIKPDVDENGAPKKRVKVQCSRIEVGDIKPTMNYWVPIEQSITTKDKRRLTHMPYFKDGQDDKEINQQMFEVFSEGIHGFGDNWDYINDWILYKMFRNVLAGYSGIPDVLYYTLYRLWPNKLTQTELSEEFPKLCERFADADFDAGAEEPWKEKAVQIVAGNLKNTECYSCLSYMCPIHGFRPEIASDFPGGDFYKVSIELPSPTDNHFCSSDECWKTSDIERAIDLLKPRSEELVSRKVTVYFDKGRLARMDAEEGLLATMYAVNSKIPFCEFAAKSVFADDEDLRIRSCRAAYEFILTVAEHPSQRRIALTLPPKHNVKAHANSFKRKHHKKGAVKQRLEEEEPKPVLLELVTPLTACRHSGPCETAENCSCSENGMCSYLCKCDLNCPQRFPGCQCGPGMCKSKLCQCYLARWECSPLTCKSCQCDGIDSSVKKCSNYSMTRLISKRLMCAPSKISGNGLFLLDSAKRDEFITEYVGERITDDEAERRGAIYDRYQTSYIFNLETGGAIDSYKVGNLARFANHDEKNPTCYARTMVIAGEHRIGFFAKCDLEPNAELTFDYSYSGEHQKVFKGSPPKLLQKPKKRGRKCIVKSD